MWFPYVYEMKKRNYKTCKEKIGTTTESSRYVELFKSANHLPNIYMNIAFIIDWRF